MFQRWELRRETEGEIVDGIFGWQSYSDTFEIKISLCPSNEHSRLPEKKLCFFFSSLDVEHLEGS